MAVANKTLPTKVSVKTFIDSQESPQRREDCRVLSAMMRRVTGKNAKMWGDSIVGYGQYYYKYDSGREGESLRTGYSPRKKDFTVYIVPGFKQYTKQLKKLGKHRHTVSCLYFKQLSDIDVNVLEEIVASAYQRTAELYPLDKKPKK